MRRFWNRLVARWTTFWIAYEPPHLYLPSRLDRMGGVGRAYDERTSDE